MNEKSHVSMEQRVCLICGVSYDTGAILLDKRLRASMERYTRTGCGLCDEHQRLMTQGYVALVECDPERSGLAAGSSVLKPSQAYRTGRLAHLKRERFVAVFNLPISDDQAIVFVEPGVIDKLETLVEPKSD